MAVANGATRRTYPEEDWERMKPLIIEKYIDEGLTLEQTMAALQARGFMATEKMYKTRFKKWGLSKYISDDKAMDVLQSGDDNLHRSHTIAGRPITKEEAKRHLKRKKRPNTWNVNQQNADEQALVNGGLLPTENVMPGSEFLTSPATDQPYPNPNLVFPDPAATWPLMNNGLTRQESLTANVFSPVQEQEDDEDVDMDMSITDMATGNYDQSMVLVDEERVSPEILAFPLNWVTENFLRSMRDFSNLTLNSVVGMQMPPLSTSRFNKLWDLFCTNATHIAQNKNDQALIVRKRAQNTFSNMLNTGDPWLLLSLCLLLNDNLSNPERVAMSSSFLNDMADWAETFQPNHPISQLVRFLQQSDDAQGEAALYLLEGTIRMILDSMKAIIGVDHDLSVEIARLHSRIMTSAGMHASAVQLLSEDLAIVENRYGVSSLPNLLRRSSLARCYFMSNDHETSLKIYEQILNDPLTQESYLADIKYGAMYFVAKSHAALGNVDLAIATAQAALRFSIEQHGPNHYWANNAQEMINKFQQSQITMSDFPDFFLTKPKGWG